MGVYKMVLVAIFGRSSTRPLRAAVLRLGGIFLLAHALGWLLATGTAGIPTNPSHSAVYLIIATAFVVQAALLFALLASLGVIRTTGRDSLARLLLLLPLHPLHRWGALLLPSMAIAIVAYTVIAWPLLTYVIQLGLTVPAFIAASMAGMLAALGGVHGFPPKQRWLQAVALPAIMGSEYTFLHLLGSTASWTLRLVSCVAVCSLIAVLCWLFWRSSRRINSDITISKPDRRMIGTTLPAWLWFTKKVIRGEGTRISIATTLGMSTALAALLARQGLGAQAALALASILAAAFTSDIRSLCSRQQPAEITTLRGAGRFMQAHLMTALVWSLLAVSPLLILTINTVSLHSIHGTQLLFAIGAGVFAGTLVVPAHRDVMGQLLATLLCTGILILVPFLPVSRSLQPDGMAVLNLLFATLFTFLAWTIEYHRNTYTWRKS
jgi:hypothetical protein